MWLDLKKKRKKERKSDTELNFLFISITKTRRSLSYLATFPHGIVAFIILRVNLSAQILTEFLWWEQTLVPLNHKEGAGVKKKNRNVSSSLKKPRLSNSTQPSAAHLAGCVSEWIFRSESLKWKCNLCTGKVKNFKLQTTFVLSKTRAHTEEVVWSSKLWVHSVSAAAALNNPGRLIDSNDESLGQGRHR